MPSLFHSPVVVSGSGQRKGRLVQMSHDGVRIGKILPCSELLEEIFLSCALPFVVGPYLALSHIKPAPCDLAVPITHKGPSKLHVSHRQLRRDRLPLPLMLLLLLLLPPSLSPFPFSPRHHEIIHRANARMRERRSEMSCKGS